MSSTAVPAVPPPRPPPPPPFGSTAPAHAHAAGGKEDEATKAQKKRLRWIKERHFEVDTSRSRDVTGCKIWKNYSEFQRAGLEGILSHFQTACSSPEFKTLWMQNGFDQPTFHPNQELARSSTCAAHIKFEQGLQSLDLGACLGVVFHGTSKGNISAILRNGLDPQRRKGQAYGPGEYFSKNPAVSVGYCHGGLEMLVFVVALPSTLPDDNNKQKDLNQVFSSPQAAFMSLPPYSNRQHRIPPDYVVVNNNHHQIPIGTMKFTQVNQSVMRDSQSRRARFLALSREVFQKEQISKETRFKASIIQDLIANRIDLASEKYQKHYGNLSFVSRREISWYAHQKVDEDVVSFYFPGLPHPFGADEIEKVALQSLDDATKQEQEAKERLEAERQKDADAQKNQNGPQQIPSGNPHYNPVLSAASRAAALSLRRQLLRDQRRKRAIETQQQNSNDPQVASPLQGILNPAQALSHAQALSKLMRNHAQSKNSSGTSVSHWTVPAPLPPPPPPQDVPNNAGPMTAASSNNQAKAEVAEALFPRLPSGRAADNCKRKREEAEEAPTPETKSDSDAAMGSPAGVTDGDSGASSSSSSGI